MLLEFGVLRRWVCVVGWQLGGDEEKWEAMKRARRTMRPGFANGLQDGSPSSRRAETILGRKRHCRRRGAHAGNAIEKVLALG